MPRGRNPYRNQAEFLSDGSLPSPSLRANPDFDADELAKKLHEAFDGVGTDEATVTELLGSYSCAQRLEMAAAYKSMYGSDAIDDYKAETSGDYESLGKALLMPPADFCAKTLYKAMKGGGTDEDTLITVLATLGNEGIADVKTAYQRIYESDLEDDVKGEVGGFLKQVLVALLSGNRKVVDEEALDNAFNGDASGLFDQTKAVEQAQELYNAGEGKFGTDEDAFLAVLVRENTYQVNAICIAYEELAGKSLADSIKGEFSGDGERALLLILGSMVDSAAETAKMLNNAMSGAGTNEKLLTYLIVTHSEVDMEEVKAAYMNMYEKPLADAIRDDVGGDYEKLLLKLIGEA